MCTTYPAEASLEIDLEAVVPEASLIGEGMNPGELRKWAIRLQIRVEAHCRHIPFLPRYFVGYPCAYIGERQGSLFEDRNLHRHVELADFSGLMSTRGELTEKLLAWLVPA